MNENYKNLVRLFETSSLPKKKIEEVIDKCTSFKIGKTGMTLEERGNSSDYASKYKWIQEVFASKDPTEVSQMEAHLINHYINYSKCDNEKNGVSSIHDEMKDGADKYYVYIVWR
jgi:hypothetical protein